jgi:Predicted phosphotransferase related to Ser/Thr protein kinases
MSDLKLRLDQFLSKNGRQAGVQQLTTDASTREYFRINWMGESAIACVYPESFVAAEQSYLDVSRLFRSNGLPVAEIYSYDEGLGIIVQEDLGDTILRDVLLKSENAVREKLIDDSIRIIAKIQGATQSAYDSNSIASRLKFDVQKLLWELNFFREHYFVTLRRSPLTQTDNAALDKEFYQLSSDLESRASVLCHRDFHAANLMIDKVGKLRIIDHQDARIGSPAYDLVSLLLDRVPEPPPFEWLLAKRSSLIDERVRLGLEAIDEDEFMHEFKLQTVQRCLKAVGTFSYQSVNRGKTYFLPYIKPMFEIVSRALIDLDRFHALAAIVERQIDSAEL